MKIAGKSPSRLDIKGRSIHKAVSETRKQPSPSFVFAEIAPGNYWDSAFCRSQTGAFWPCHTVLKEYPYWIHILRLPLFVVCEILVCIFPTKLPHDLEWRDISQ